MAKPKVSIIVPMYNVEAYLGDCLDSLLSQSLRDIEIVAVDDGSPDSSRSIAEAYAKRDSRVKVVHRENGGLGPARNTGIEYATGEYIGFVDSDDWADRDMFLSLYKAAVEEQADIVVGGYEIWSNGKVVSKKTHPLAGRTLRGKKEVEPYRRLMLGRLPDDGGVRSWPIQVWTSIYRAEMVESSRVRFKDIRSEDMFFNIKIWKSANCVSHVSECGYRYRKDYQPSITTSFNPDTAEDFLEVFRSLLACAESEEDPDDARLRVCRQILDYGRTYVYMVEKSGLDINQKVAALKRIAKSPEFIENCKDYPTENLSRLQSLIHRALVCEKYRTALVLAWIRTVIKGER